MLTGKQRSYLKSLVNTQDSIIQVGKGGITENVIKQIDETLESRELIKITVLSNSPSETDEVCDEILNNIDAEFVQKIGRKISIYRKSKEPKIFLP